METGIRRVEISEDDRGEYTDVRVVFGPHYFLELHREEGGGVTFALGVTHHGFRADASEVGGELEAFIDEARAAHADNLVD
jgi:hypothetical protein